MNPHSISNKRCLSNKRYLLLLKVFKDVRCFDRKDNTFRLSNRMTANKLGVSIYSINTLMNTLKSKGLTKAVVTTTGEATMLNPSFLFKKPRKYHYWYSKGLWYYGNHLDTIRWIDFCWEDGNLVNPDTGEVLKHTKLHYIFNTTRKYKSGYKEFIMNIEINHPEIGYSPLPVRPGHQ